MLAAGGNGPLFGQFLLNRNGIARWTSLKFRRVAASCSVRRPATN